MTVATVLRVIAAAISIVIGFAGLILPVLPGWLFFGLAAALLFPDSRLVRKMVAKIEQRFPSTRRLMRFLIGRQ